jgi:hypothetical protein
MCSGCAGKYSDGMSPLSMEGDSSPHRMSLKNDIYRIQENAMAVDMPIKSQK